MEKAFVIFVLVIGFANMVADGPIRDFFNWIWIGFWGLFFLCLIIYYQLDHKGFFLPENLKSKKGKKES